MSETRPHDEPRLKQGAPQGGMGGSAPSLEAGSTWAQTARPGGRTVGVLPDRRAGRRADGFSLIELLNVLMIIGVLVAVALVVVVGATKRARESAAIAYMKSWIVAVELFRQDRDQYPASLAQLAQDGYLVLMQGKKIQYTFALAQKVARAPAPPRHVLAKGREGSWWGAVARWSLASSAWADHDPGHVGGNSGGWEGWGTPVGGKGKHLYTDETGTIRYAIDAPATVESPAI